MQYIAETVTTHHLERRAYAADAVRNKVKGDVLAAYGAILGGAGFVRRGKNEYAALCPLHPDRHPSLRVSAEKALWWCDPCGRGGDAFDLYAAAHDLDVRAEFVRIADELGALLGVASAGRSAAAAKGGTPTCAPHRPTAIERLAYEIAHERAPAPPRCCLNREVRCPHWLEFDRQLEAAYWRRERPLILAELRLNIRAAILELAEKAAGGIDFRLEPRMASNPIDAAELRAGVEHALPFGAIISAGGIPNQLISELISDEIGRSSPGKLHEQQPAGVEHRQHR